MGDKPADDGKHEPSLELPSLFGRKKKAKDAPHAEPAEPGAVSTSEPAAAAEAAADEAGGGSERAVVDRASGGGFSLPRLSGPVAAITTGLVVGAFGTVLTYLSMAGCEGVRGTSTCGGPGLFLLIAILVLMILLGALILKAWKVSDPASTSFLAVGLVAVVVLVALIDVIFSIWMFLLVPAIGAASYVLAHWVTTRLVDDSGGGPPHHDVR